MIIKTTQSEEHQIFNHDKPLNIAWFYHHTDKQPKPEALAWSQLCQQFEKPLIRATKTGEYGTTPILFAPASFNGTRKKENVTELSLLMLERHKQKAFL